MPTKNPNLTTERDLSIGVLRILHAHDRELASYSYLKKYIPAVVNLSEDDWTPSVIRNGEPMWHQRVRNIKSHDKMPGNFIFEGYLYSEPGKLGITQAGKRYIAGK